MTGQGRLDFGRWRRLASVLASLLVVALPLAACSGGGSADSSRKLTVYAAASLKEVFTQLARDFEGTHPGSSVVLSFGPSSGLARQITEGAPADVFASADAATMATVKDQMQEQPQVFAQNTLTIALPSNRPPLVRSVDDLARPEVKVALCAPKVPCGVVAARVLAAAGLTVRPVTREVDVKAVLTKVTLGEVDAGLVYRTDVRAAGDKVREVPLPVTPESMTPYPIAVLKRSQVADLARDFAESVRSAEGEKALTEAGFAVP